MSIDLPEELVWALGFIGPAVAAGGGGPASRARWAPPLPASSLMDTHGAAHATVQGLSRDNFGLSMEAMLGRWGQASATHLHDLVEGCHVFAVAVEETITGLALHAVEGALA
jgi:hypothetical protein